MFHQDVEVKPKENPGFWGEIHGNTPNDGISPGGTGMALGSPPWSSTPGNGCWGNSKGGQLVFFWKEGKYAKLDLQQS